MVDEAATGGDEDPLGDDHWDVDSQGQLWAGQVVVMSAEEMVLVVSASADTTQS